MIIEFSIQNLFSFKEKKTLSFVATDDTTYEDYYVVQAGRYKLLKTAFIYGPNASGKSNVLKAFDILGNIIAVPKPKDVLLPWYPFLLDPETRTKNSILELKFMVPEEKDSEELSFTEYEYLVEFNSERIVHEKLSCYLSSRASLIYERFDNNGTPAIRFGKIVGLNAMEKMIIASNTVKSSSVLSSLKKVSLNVKFAGDVLNWFHKRTSVPIFPNMNLTDFSSNYILGTDSSKQLVSILSNADLNISDVRFEDRELSAEFVVANGDKEADIIPDVPVKRQTQKIVSNIFLKHYCALNGKTESAELPYFLESNGTHKSLGLSGLFLKCIREDRILAIDEIETSLHYDILKYFILVFLKNSKNTQLICTTHDLMLLNADFIRKDVIWFTDKQEDASTDLYALVEFKGLDRMNILKSYMNGKFGAYPDIFDFDLNL